MNPILRKTLPLLAIAAATGPRQQPRRPPARLPRRTVSPSAISRSRCRSASGTRTNPVAGRSDIPLFVVPHISYYGKRFFLESLEPGVTLYESDANTFNLIATPGFDRVFFSRNDLQNVVVAVRGGRGAAVVQPLAEPKSRRSRSGSRHTTYLAGPEWMFRHRDFIGQVNALYEVTGRHHGYEVRAAVSAPLVQTKQSLVDQCRPDVEERRDRRLLLRRDRISIDPDGALNPFVKLSYALPLSARWTLTPSCTTSISTTRSSTARSSPTGR